MKIVGVTLSPLQLTSLRWAIIVAIVPTACAIAFGGAFIYAINPGFALAALILARSLGIDFGGGKRHLLAAAILMTPIIAIGVFLKHNLLI